MPSLWVSLVLLAHVANAHNTYYDCSRVALDTGLTVMGQVTTLSTDRVMQVFRAGVELSSGDLFDPGEVLTVSMSVTTGEQLLEVSGGAEYTGGACDGSSRFYGGSTEVTMVPDNDVSFWGGWAGGYGAVSITAKFMLVSSGNPVSNSPSAATSIAPTTVVEEVASSYSVSLQVATTGVTTTALQQEIVSLGGVFCAHLSLASTLCLTTFVSNSEVTPNDLQFDLLVSDFPTQVNASDANTVLQQYLLDTAATGFIEEFFTASGLRFTVATYQSSEVTESSSDVSNAFAYSCSLSDHLKLSWRVEAQGDGTSSGEAGGYITGSLTMLSTGSTPWFASGVVENSAVAMVSSPEHVVYFYEPNSQQAGMYRISDYSSSAIIADTRIRTDTGVLGKHTSQTSTSINFQQSRITDVAVDPVLALDAEGDFNTIIWAHGGVWPNAHTSSNRGFVTVYWLDGACVALPEDDPDTAIAFFVSLLVLMVVGVLVVRLDLTPFKDFQVMFHFRRTLRQLLPSFIPLTHDFSAFTLRSSIAIAAYLAIVAIFLKQTADFYEDDRGYDTGRAYSFSLGYAALFSAGLTIIPVNKSGIIVALFRIPFDRATKFHRICGGLTMILVLTHAIQIIDFWGKSEVLTMDTSKKVGEAHPAFGLLAACCFGAMALTAPFAVRSRAYELFQLVHCLFLPAMVFIILHVPKSGKILIAPLAFYGLDAVYTIYQEFLPVINVSVTSPYSKYTVLKVKAKHIENVQPGQYCLVNIAPASYFQWHPISICSYDRETHELTFIIKNVGDWTAKICDVVNSAGSDDDGAMILNFKVRLRGPFGRIRFDLGADVEHNVYRYEKLILIAGGIGCTPMISTLQWLIDNAKDRGNVHRLHVTVLITARDREMFSLFGEFFKIFNGSNVFQEGGIDLRLYCTTDQRPSQTDSTGSSSLEIQTLRSSETGDVFLGSVANLTVPITYSRPDLVDEIETVCACRESVSGRVCVLVCGPAGIVTAVQKGCHAAVNKFGPVLELHEESFRL